MVVAIASTKTPILLGQDFWIFHLPADMKRVGFWAAQHEALPASNRPERWTARLAFCSTSTRLGAASPM
jgi:hypothetical protein